VPVPGECPGFLYSYYIYKIIIIIKIGEGKGYENPWHPPGTMSLLCLALSLNTLSKTFFRCFFCA
jgi:hypothetical protein